MAPRRPTRLLEYANKSSAYPRELLANLDSGELTLIDNNGNEVATNPLSTETSETGNAVKEITVNGRKIIITKATYLTEHPTIPTSADGTDTAANPGFGGTFNVVSTVTRDGNGHVTQIKTKTVTMPSAQTSVTGNAGTADKLKTARTISLSGGATGSTTFDGSADATINVTTLDGSKITGTVPLSSIPKGAQERMVPVENDTARLALTSSDVQNGDVVKVTETGLMYYVADETRLGTEAAFSVFTAGAASSVPWTGVTDKPTFAAVATSGSYNDLSNKPTIPSAGTTTPNAAGTGNAGSASTYSRSDHTHPAQTSVSGNAGSADKLSTARTIALTGDATGSTTFDGSKNVSIEATLANSGVTADSYGPTENKTAAAGDSFVIPQVTVDAKGRVTDVTERTITLPATPGSVGIADKLSAARTIALSGDASGSTSFDGSENVTINATLANSGVTAGSYGPSANASPAHGTSFSVPQVTVDAKGRVTGATSRTITMPDVSHPTIPTTADGTDTAVSPEFGGNFSVVSAVTRDANGHVTQIKTKSVTLPDAPTSVSGNAGTADKLKTARTISLSGGATGSASFDGSADMTINVTSIDGSKITGEIPLSSIPKGAQERMVPVANMTAMLALTSSDVQNGDVVKLEDTGVMYYVIDDTNLGTEAAFSVFTAGAASSVPWTGVTDKPTFAAVATSGSYNDLSNKPTIPSAGTTTPSAASTSGSAGSASTYSKSDHSHPAQTSVTGNAGTATKLAAAKNIALTGDVSGSASFDGSADASINATLANSGVTAGSYGPSTNSAPGGSGTFSVPQVTVDAKGRVTSATSRTITMPDVPDVSAYVHVGSESEMTDPIEGTALTTLDIADNLTSTNTDKALSANQGKVLSDRVTSVESTANAASNGLSNKLNVSGGTMTGKLIAQNNTDYTVKQVRNIFISTSAPTSSDGDNGDIWLVYEA